MVERILGKAEVVSSILTGSTSIPLLSLKIFLAWGFGRRLWSKLEAYRKQAEVLCMRSMVPLVR